MHEYGHKDGSLYPDSSAQPLNWGGSACGDAGCKADYALLCKKTYVAREHMTAGRLKGD